MGAQVLWNKSLCVVAWCYTGWFSFCLRLPTWNWKHQLWVVWGTRKTHSDPDSPKFLKCEISGPSQSLCPDLWTPLQRKVGKPAFGTKCSSDGCLVTVTVWSSRTISVLWFFFVFFFLLLLLPFWTKFIRKQIHWTAHVFQQDHEEDHDDRTHIPLIPYKAQKNLSNCSTIVLVRLPSNSWN